jgi:NADPH:quinone reductase-like Zn-dependent oxidoreductase
MPPSHPDTALQLHSLVTAGGALELSLARVPVPEPAAGEVLVRVEAAPINPSDLGPLLASADMSTARVSGSSESPVVTANIPPQLRPAVAGRIGQSLPMGNEGAGVVVAAGAGAEALIGKTVAIIVPGMFAQYRCVKAADCLVLPPGATPLDGASSFVNPLTVLAMVEVVRREGSNALVHTAAASNLGQMLNRLCIADGVDLVNIVRSPDQARVLRDAGAAHVCDSTAPDFMDALTAALLATGATIAFDAIGGGTLASQILTAMEAAAIQKAGTYTPYGTLGHKQIHMYGNLDTGPTILHRAFGMSWGIGRWLLGPHFLSKIAPEEVQKMRERIATELTTTFTSSYSRVVSLADALSLDAIAAYGRRATGEKYLVNPNMAVS